MYTMFLCERDFLFSFFSGDETAVERRRKYSSTDFRDIWLTVAATNLEDCFVIVIVPC